MFKSITHQAHVPTLSEGFELTLHKNVNGVAAPGPEVHRREPDPELKLRRRGVEVRPGDPDRSGGPKANRAEDAGTYPIVMDAAFGSLDQDYQEAVSRALAKMAPQLVVLVSKSQGLGKVVTELLPVRQPPRGNRDPHHRRRAA